MKVLVNGIMYPAIVDETGKLKVDRESGSVSVKEINLASGRFSATKFLQHEGELPTVAVFIGQGFEYNKTFPNVASNNKWRILIFMSNSSEFWTIDDQYDTEPQANEEAHKMTEIIMQSWSDALLDRKLGFVETPPRKR